MLEKPPRLPRNSGRTEGAGDPLSASGVTLNPDTASSLELRLFGPIQVRVGGQPLPHLRSRKGLWLLALLALRDGRDVDRDWLAGTLWPECDEAHARTNLRQSLHDLRRALGTEAWRLASDEPRTLHLELDGMSVDVLEFDAAMERGDPASLASAVELYRGPLLEDCSEEWALEGRGHREQAVVRALETLAFNAAERHEHGLAAGRLRAVLRIDPFREDLQRALMEALDADGSPAAAMAAYRDYRARLARELMGEPAAETAALFNRLKEESRARAKPTAQPRQSRVQSSTNSPAHRTLPSPLTALIGREEAILHVVSLADRARLITLTGTGGVGKTRLAIQVAEESASGYLDGVVFVDLAPLENGELLPNVVRTVCAAPEEDGTQDPVEALCSHLATRRTLLVLDNCEHLGSACGPLAERLLSRCADLKILATSREVLGVKGETVWRVPSLAIPKTGTSKAIPVAEIGHVSTYQDFAAVRLFAERARAAESTFELTRKNSVAVVKICTRLDGIPLAIELAAARVKSMPVEKIAERLNERFRILLGRRRSQEDAPVPRHQTLRASIDWSYDLLLEQEAVLLRRLAVFAGGWTLEAAEAVCSGGPVPEWEVLDLLAGLVEKSLVVYQPDEDRYHLLETIRQYLTERLDDEGVRATVAAKHLDHFLAFAEAARPELIGPRQAEWMDRLESDHDNFRAALSWSRSAVGSIEKGYLLIAGIWRFWQVRGFVAEGRAQIDQALSISTEPAENRAKALGAGGILAYRQSDFPAARLLFEESLAIRRDLGDLGGIAAVLNNLANITKAQGDHEAARAQCEESLAIYRQLGDRWCTATCLQNLGSVYYDLGDYETAHVLYEESHAIHLEFGDPTSIAFSFSRLGNIAHERREFAAARSLHEKSLAIRRELGDRLCIAMSLYDLALTTHALGDHSRAQSLQRESLLIQRDLGNRAGTVQSLEAFAEMALDDPSHSTDSEIGIRAARLLGAAEGLRGAIGLPFAPNEKESYRRQVDRTRETMDEEAFAAAWAEGRAMTLDEAISFALD